MNDAFDVAAFVWQARDAIVATNCRGAIVLWNTAATRLFGYSPEEALGRTLDIIIPPRFRQQHWDAFHEAISAGTTSYGHRVLRVPSLHRDGQILSIAFTVTLLLTSTGEVDTIVAIIRDDSQRWQDEREMRKRIADLERRVTEND